MKIQKVYLIIIAAVSAVIAGTYAFMLLGLPRILNSEKMVEKYQELLSRKLNSTVSIDNFNMKTNPDLSISLSIDKLSSPSIFEVDRLNLRTKSFSIRPKNVDADKIFVNFDNLKPLLTIKDDKNRQFKLKYFPIINVKSANIKFGKYEAVLKDVKSYKEGGSIYCTFWGEVLTPYSNSPIIVGENGGIHYFRKLYFDDLSVSIDNSKFLLAGAIDKLRIRGQKILASEAKSLFLTYYKTKHPHKKNFIENFSNFSGFLDADLLYTKKGLYGQVIAKNLAADFFSYKIPIFLPNVVFDFDSRKMSAKSKGTFGGEPVETDVLIRGLFTDSVHTVGHVKSVLTSKFSAKYFPLVKISGTAPAGVRYDVKSGVADVDYSLKLPTGSDLLTKKGNLGNTDKFRKITAQTRKFDDKLVLKNYDYSFIEEGNDKKLISGDGLFEKKNGHFKPKYLSLKTNGNLSTFLISSLLNDVIYGGTFVSDIKYDFSKNLLSGYLKLSKVWHEDFLFLDSAVIKADKSVDVNAFGTFFDSPITLSLLADNNFKDGLLVKDIDIHLNQFIVRRGGFGAVKSKYNQNLAIRRHKHQDTNITVENGRIKVDEIFNSKFQLHDVEILGKLKDNIVDFTIPQTSYSKGQLSAEGKYDIKKHDSDIYFSAFEIDSNEVASKIFNLPDYFTGLASASLHLKTKNKLSDIKAFANFAIEDGMMPKLGNREIILNKSKKRKNLLYYIKKPIKFTLSKITNIDFTNKQILSTDLCGCFELDNSEVSDVRIYAQSDFLSMFIEGDYNIDSQVGKLELWGKHNKVAEKKVKILKLPFSLLYKIFFKVERSKNMYADKINEIPSINAKPEEIGIFRVKIDGNLNSNDIKVIMKDLR